MSDIGIDIPINVTRQAFEDNLWTTKDYTAYGRAYRNETKDGMVPEYHVDGKITYKDVLLNRKLDAISFFDIVPGTGISEHFAIVDIYFAVNLAKLYPLLTNRATEQAIADVMTVLYRTAFRIQGTERGLSSFQPWALVNPDHNLQPYFLFKISTEVMYQFTDC